MAGENPIFHNLSVVYVSVYKDDIQHCHKDDIEKNDEEYNQ